MKKSRVVNKILEDKKYRYNYYVFEKNEFTKIVRILYVKRDNLYFYPHVLHTDKIDLKSRLFGNGRFRQAIAPK